MTQVLSLDSLLPLRGWHFILITVKKATKLYLKYISAEDIHVYSIDEVFIDVTSYPKTVNKSPREFAKMIIQDIYKTTGITATAGIRTNLYLAKVAMDTSG